MLRLGNFGHSKLINNVEITKESSSKSGVALRILGLASKVGEKGVVLKVGEKAASYLTPLHAPVKRV